MNHPLQIIQITKTPQSAEGFVVFYQNSISKSQNPTKPNQLQNYHIWMCVKLTKKQPPQWKNQYID